MKLREYQSRAVDNVRNALHMHGDTILVAPTGAGKTVIAAAVAKAEKNDDAATRRFKLLFIVHNRRLLKQAAAQFSRYGFRVSAVAGSKADYSGEVVVAMVRMLSNRVALKPKTMAKFTHVIVDEAHRAATKVYDRVFASLAPDCRKLGITATPRRGKRRGIGASFGNNIADVIDIRELLDLGFLVPPRALTASFSSSAVSDTLDRAYAEKSEEKAARVASAAVSNVAACDEVVRWWQEHGEGRRTVVFCTDKTHVANMVASFDDAGIACEGMTDATPEKDRDETIERLESGETLVVVNCQVLTEGFDCPPLSCVVIARPMVSKTLFVQSIGRGLRPHPDTGKLDCLVLDFAQACKRHDMQAELSIRDKTRWNDEEALRFEGDVFSKTCPECRLVVPNGVRQCPSCDHDFVAERVSRRVVAMQSIELAGAETAFVWSHFKGDKFGRYHVSVAGSGTDERQYVFAVTTLDGSKPSVLYRRTSEGTMEVVDADTDARKLLARAHAFVSLFAYMMRRRHRGRFVGARATDPASDKQLAKIKHMARECPVAISEPRTKLQASHAIEFLKHREALIDAVASASVAEASRLIPNDDARRAREAKAAQSVCLADSRLEDWKREKRATGH